MIIHTDYTVVIHVSLHQIMTDVRELLKQGWICQGSISETHNRFVQALVKVKEV